MLVEEGVLVGGEIIWGYRGQCRGRIARDKMYWENVCEVNDIEWYTRMAFGIDIEKGMWVFLSLSG